MPLPSPDLQFATYKVSKRRDQDISTVAAGFALRLEAGLVAEFRAGFGGMAAVPARAPALEATLLGRPWTPAVAEAAALSLAQDFSPLTDARGSSAYREAVARNLVVRFCLETIGAGERLEDLADA